MTAEEALQALVQHLLGKDWYSIYWNSEDIHQDIVETIRSRYRGKKEDRITKWRRRHKPCMTCRHFDEYWIDNELICECDAKCKLIGRRDRRPFCGLYEVMIPERIKKNV